MLAKNKTSIELLFIHRPYGVDINSASLLY